MQVLFLHSDRVIHALSWTLIHSLWQGLFAAILAAVVIIATRKTVASLRYNLLLAITGLFVVSAIVTFCLQINGDASEPVKLAEIKWANDDSFTQLYSSTTVTNKAGILNSIAAYCDRNASLFVMVWVTIFFLHCIKLLNGFGTIRRFRRQDLYYPGADWRSCFQRLCSLVGIYRPVTLAESALVKVPVAIGFLKPIILIPVGMLSQLPADQVETILLHELAHIRRQDYLVNILQRMVEAVFFFNPAILWISSVLRREREACCDDIVIANTAQRGSYLEALVSFQEYTLANAGHAMAIGNNRNFLLNRVKRMITRENQKLNSMEKLCLTVGLMSIMAFTFVPAKHAENKIKEPIMPSATKAVPAAIVPEKKVIVAVSTAKQQKPVSMVKTTVAPADTVPSKKENKKEDYQELSFPSMSSNVNDDGKTRTESVSLTDQKGKKYSYTKQNDKITSFTIDGKKIPESQYGDYTDLFGQIDRAMAERRMMNQKMREMRRLEVARRSDELRTRTAERRMMSDYDRTQKQLMLEQRELMQRNQRLQGKTQNEIRRIIEDHQQNERRNQRQSEQKQRELLRRIERIRQRQAVPMINGREVSSAKELRHMNTDLVFDGKPEIYFQKDQQLFKTKSAASLKPLKKVLHVESVKSATLFRDGQKMYPATEGQKLIFRSSKPLFPKSGVVAKKPVVVI